MTLLQSEAGVFFVCLPVWGKLNVGNGEIRPAVPLFRNTFSGCGFFSLSAGGERGIIFLCVRIRESE